MNAWFDMQELLPETDGAKRAASTLKENRREANNLIRAWGHFESREITKAMGYQYLAACKNKRPEKGNKEMSLARLILEWGIARGELEANPLKDLTKNSVVPKEKRRVTAKELALAVKTGKKMGGPYHIVALGLKTAWLCVRRSVEVRALTQDGIKDEGIEWTDGKDRHGVKASVVIEWSAKLRVTIDEALAIKRYSDAGTMYIFGNMRGQRYTKGGWKKMLHNLMTECVKVAQANGESFQKFSLQDCRPMGVSDKLDKGHKDVQEATLHTNGQMVAKVYDRRKKKRAKPVE